MLEDEFYGLRLSVAFLDIIAKICALQIGVVEVAICLTKYHSTAGCCIFILLRETQQSTRIRIMNDQGSLRFGMIYSYISVICSMFLTKVERQRGTRARR